MKTQPFKRLGFFMSSMWSLQLEKEKLDLNSLTNSRDKGTF